MIKFLFQISFYIHGGFAFLEEEDEEENEKMVVKVFRLSKLTDKGRPGRQRGS